MKKLLSAGLLLLGLLAVPAQAAVSYYNDVNAFDAALDSVTVEDFDDVLLVPGLSFVSSVGSIGGGVFNDQLVIGLQETRFNFGSAINGFGGFFDLTPGGPGYGILLTISLFAGGIEVLSMEIPNSYAGEFFGFISTNAFDSVLLTGGSMPASAETYNLNDLHFGAVPEPASLALLGFALAGLAMSRRKQA